MTTRDIVGDPEFAARAEAVLAAGDSRCALQVRGHGLDGGRLWETASRLAVAARRVGAEIWINDRIDVALGIRADGVQLGKASLPTREARRLLGGSVWIGRSVHAAEEATAARSEGADMALLGHVYETATHPQAKPLGPGILRQAAAARPIVAIGGITPDRVEEVMEAGAWGVAVVSGVWDATDPAAAARSYLEALERFSNIGAAEAVR